MTSVTLHPPTRPTARGAGDPLPQLIQTPSGMALLELQGTINLPERDPEESGSGAAAESSSGIHGQAGQAIPIGRIDFPEYRADALDPTSTAWMKRAYMYVGEHQRLTGEVRKLPRPVAVVRRRRTPPVTAPQAGAAGDAVLEDPAASNDGEAPPEELEVVEIVRYKIVFSARPEPVNTSTT